MPSPTIVEPAASPVATAENANEHVPMLVKQLLDSGVTSEQPVAGDQDEAANKKPEDRAPEKKPDAAKPDKKPDAAKPDEDPPMKVRGPKIVRPELRFQEEAQPAKKPAVVEPAKPDPEWEKGLEENEREMLADARYSEQRFPDRHKGLATRTEKFLRDHTKFITDQGEEFDPESAEYKTFLAKNQPRLSAAEIREINETRVADRVGKEWQGKHADLQHKLYVRDEEPKIDAEARVVWNELTNNALPEEVVKAIKADGYDKAEKVYSLEIETAQQVLTAATEDIKEFMRLNRNDPESGRALSTLAEKPTDAKFQQHIRLGQAVSDICDDFKKTAPLDQQMRNGKWFVTRDEFNRLTKESQAKTWSFTNKEIIERMKGVAKVTVAQAIKQKLEYLEGRGFKRSAPVVVKPDERKPEQSPRAPGPSMSPGATDAPSGGISPETTRLMTGLQREQ